MFIMVRMTFVNYICPSCQTKRQVGGTIPPTCPACGQVICHVCGETGFCPTCFNYLNQDEKSFYNSIRNAGSNLASLACIYPGFCCGLLLVLVGVLIIFTPTGAHDIGLILAVLGALLTVILGPIYFIKNRGLKKHDKKLNAVFDDLVLKIKQRRM